MRAMSSSDRLLRSNALTISATPIRPRIPRRLLTPSILRRLRSFDHLAGAHLAGRVCHKLQQPEDCGGGDLRVECRDELLPASVDVIHLSFPSREPRRLATPCVSGNEL